MSREVSMQMFSSLTLQISLFQAFSWSGRSAENSARKNNKAGRVVFCTAPSLTESLEEANSRCFHWFQAATLELLRRAPTWRLHTKHYIIFSDTLCRITRVRNIVPPRNFGTLFLILIIKITLSSLVIGLKMSYFPLIRLPSCYRTVCYWIVCYWTVCYRTV